MPRVTIHSPDQPPEAPIELEYETFGDRRDPAMLLIMGLGSQMVLWDDAFCAQLAGHGFFVIRYDSRDVGRSTRLQQSAGPLRVVYALVAAALGYRVRSPYSLSDMANDAVGLLDALAIEAAHVVGSSMGGMVAQLLAIEHPTRALSLTSISSTTSDPALPKASLEALARISRPPPLGYERYLPHTVEVQRFINGPILPFDEARARRLATRVFERGLNIGGATRHFLALLAAPNRREQLARLTIPALIIHGSADPVAALACGRATADAIPGAKLHVVAGMGHDLSPLVWDEVIDHIVELANQRSGTMR